MKESVAIAKEADAKKRVSPTKSDKSTHRARNEPERQLGSLRSVIGNIRRDGGKPSVENIATELSVMPYSDRASALLALQQIRGNQYVQRVVTLARKGNGETEVALDVEQAIQRARGDGQSMDKSMRGQMESAFGADFSGVRVHTDTEADTLNRMLNARAFTTCQDIFFRQGEYNPSSSSGRKLMAHELTHVVQQNGDKVQSKLTVAQPGDRYEQEAERMASLATSLLKETPPDIMQYDGGRKGEERPVTKKLLVQRLPEDESSSSGMIITARTGEMAPLEAWLQQVRTSGELRRRTPHRTWEAPFGPETRTKRLWAFSSLHRWVWNINRQYDAYQELPEDLELLRQRLGRTTPLQRIFGEVDVMTVLRSNRDFNQRIRHYLMQGMRPRLAHTTAVRQLTEEARLIIIRGVACGAGGFSTGMNYVPIAGEMLGPTVQLHPSVPTGEPHL
jgi:hypothetical protein